MGSDASAPRLSTTGSAKDYEPHYYGESKPEVTTSNGTALETGERRGDTSSGAKAPLKVGEVGGQSYPGRTLPATEKVEEAKPREGVAKKCAETQLQENRRDLKG